MNQPTLKPTQKVTAVGAAGALVTVIVAVLAAFNIQVPQEVSSAALVVVSAITTIVTFVAGYMKKEKK